MKHWRIPMLTLTLAFTAACADDMAEAPLVPDDDPAHAESADASDPGVVPGEYIVVFRENAATASANVPTLAASLAATHGGEVKRTYTTALRGFAARLPEPAVRAVANNPNVAYVEPNRRARLFDTQNDATWGIDRVDQRDLPLSSTYTWNNDGSGAHAYIFDTGVNLSHAEFGGRAQYVPNGSNGNFVGDGATGDDCHGHGTHVAGTVGGSTYGVAKGANIWAARVIDCSGSGDVSMVISAIDWVTANGQRPAVVNMSLGYSDVQSLRDAVANSVQSGIVYAVAAGNGHWLFGYPLDACNESPAGEPLAITVGATQSNDAEASFSNYGTCVDILAPGVSITSADYQGGSVGMSGTSMATPHVAGAAALYLSANPSATPAQVDNALKSNGTANTIDLHADSESGGTPNLFLYTGFIGGDGGGGDTNAAPTANFASSCTELSCSFTDQSSDSDGEIASYSWSFGDGATSTTANPSHTYAAGGTYTVTLTVTDDGGATDSHSGSVTVTEPSSGGIALTTNGYKNKGRHHIDLSWSGAASSQVDVYRNGSLLTATANDGAYTDATNNRGGGSYTHQVCEAGTSTCSDVVTTTF